MPVLKNTFDVDSDDISSAVDALFTPTTNARVGKKTEFDRVPAFYLGGGVKQHFPYVRDQDGNKVVKKDSSAKFTEYEREATSDGWIFTLHTPAKEPLYVVTPGKPDLHAGSFYFISGLGYGHGDDPTFLDEKIKLVRVARLTRLEAGEEAVDVGGEN